MRKSLLLSAVLGLCASVVAPTMLVATTPYWNWRNPTPQGNDYQAVAYGAGRFVAVGKAGTITTSTDGTTWTAANSGVTNEIADVAYGNGRFVARGYVPGSSGLLISEDGLSWRIPEASVPAEWSSVTRLDFVVDRFYAMNDSAHTAGFGRHAVATSPDGVTWTLHAEATSARVGRIAFGGGSFVGQDMGTGLLAGSGGGNWPIHEAKMMRSTDGVTWTEGGGTGLAAIGSGPVYYGDRWVVGGTLATTSGGGQQFFRALSTSTDGGATWSIAWQESVIWGGGNQTLPGLAVMDGKLYFLGDHNVPVSSTTDFVAVRTDVPDGFLQLNDVVAADRVVAVGRYGRIVTSVNGTDWTVFGTSTVIGNLRAAAFGDGRWIAAGEAGLASSPDGITWQMLPSGADYRESIIAFGNGRFVAGKALGQVGVSTDGGLTWTDSGAVGVRGRLAFAQGRFVAASGLVSSTDGLTWTAPVPIPGGTGSWTSVFQVDGVFYGIGTTDPAQTREGLIARSVDGLSWTIVATMAQGLQSVGGRAGLLVASGTIGEVWTSVDGIIWQQVAGRPLMNYGAAASILWVGNSLVAATFGGHIVTSVDGVTWVKDEFASSGTMFALAAGNGQVLAVGAGGVIWEVGAARFTVQPESRTVAPGASVTFSVGAMGKEPLSYQWLKDGAPLAGGADRPLSAYGSSAGAPTLKAASVVGVGTPTLTLASASAADSGRYSVIVSNEFGSTESSPATLFVGQAATPPVLTSQPQSRTAAIGASVTFSVEATGNAPLSYQWFKGDFAIPSATGSSYTIGWVFGTDDASYSVVVTNSAGSVRSNAATLTVVQPISAPTIGTQPEPQTVAAGAPVTLNVVATGGGPLIYQWRKDGVEIAGATGATYTLPAASAADGGTYTVVVRNSAGVVTSNGVTLTVLAARLVNISTRAFATTDNGVTIGGFVVAGGVPKQVLIRAVGPTLTTFGLPASEVLADPTIELYRGATVLAINDNWGDGSDAAAITSAAQRLGATPLAAADTKSAAMLMTLDPGVYTFMVKGKDATSGVVLLEVYDADANGSSFANISTRAYATTDYGVAIGGFVITGNAPKKVLMRAMGPTLETYGLQRTELLLDPTMELRQGSTTVATNDNWGDGGNAAEIGQVAASIGAAPLSAGDTHSAAMLMTLEPGVYSFLVKGKDNTSGLVLVELYAAD